MELTAGVDQKRLQSSYFLECLMTDNRRHVFVKIVSGHLLMQVSRFIWNQFSENHIKRAKILSSIF